MDEEKLTEIKALSPDQQSTAYLEQIALDVSSIHKWVTFYGILTILGLFFGLLSAFMR